MSPAADISELIARWNGEPGTLAHVRDGANSVFRFQAVGAPRILRVTSDSHRSRTQLEAELDFVRFVAAHGVTAAEPVRSQSGAWVESFAADDGSISHCVSFTAVAGRHFEFFSADIDRPLFRAWGAAMGKLHTASREFLPEPGRRRPRWSDQDSTSCNVSELPPAEIEARREHARVAEWLAGMPSSAATWGLIHGDFERTNFVLTKSALSVYDFDDACYHWYLADVANALWAFRNAPAEDRRRFVTWFVEGYREWGTLEDDLEDQLSWFVRLRSLTLFIHRRAAPNANERWLERMRREFQSSFHWVGP